MEQIVRVKSIAANGRAQVLHVRQSACSGDCHKCSGCGAAQETMILEADNPIGAAVGDFVTIQAATGPVLKGAAMLYMLPLVLFFLGYWLGDVLLSRGALMGSLAFLLAICLTVVYDRKIAKKEEVHTITGYAHGHR